MWSIKTLIAWFYSISFAYQLLQISLAETIFPEIPYDVSRNLMAMEGLRVHKTMNFGLTHWGRDKMAAIFQMKLFKYIFLNENA